MATEIDPLTVNIDCCKGRHADCSGKVLGGVGLSGSYYAPCQCPCHKPQAEAPTTEQEASES